MAFVGLSRPYVAKLVDEAAKTYSDCFKCGKAISLSVTPNYNEVKLYADNVLDEYVKEFKDGTISLGTDRLPKEAQTVMFGHVVTEDSSKGTSEITYKSNDNANYVGIGFVIDEVLDSKKSFTATIIYKCKFTEAADSYTTKGDSIEFKTPTVEGAIAALEDYVWKTVKTFSTAEDAEKFLKDTLGYVEPSGSGASGI